MSRAKKKAEYDRCQEDCFNCIYADCIKPDYLLKSDTSKDGRGKYDRTKAWRWVKERKAKK